MSPDSRYNRHEGYLATKIRDIPINFIGAGSVGSHMAIMFLRMGFLNAQVFDPDVVVAHNLGNQDYPNDAVGKFKVLALYEEALRRTGVQVLDNTAEAYIGQPLLPGLVISAVDSMQARREIWTHLKDNPVVERYIDTRMGLLQGNMYVVDPRDRKRVEWYERQLVGEGSEQPCDARVVQFTVLGIAWMVGAYVARYVRGEEDKEHPLAILDSRNLTVQLIKPREE